METTIGRSQRTFSKFNFWESSHRLLGSDLLPEGLVTKGFCCKAEEGYPPKRM